jgi:hypothetical protein
LSSVALSGDDDGLQLPGLFTEEATVQVEVGISRRLPSFTIGGVPGTAIRQSPEVAPVRRIGFAP